MNRCSENQDITLPFELSYIPDDLKRRAKSELFEDEETRNHSIRLLKSLLKDESGLNWQDDDLFLLSFLRARKFDVKRAFNLVKTFYTVVGKHDRLYYNFNYEDVSRTVKENIVGFLPYRDVEGSVILIIRSSNWNPGIVSLGDIMRTLSCGLLHANLIPATHIAGFKVIVDFSGFTVNHVCHVSPTYLKLFAAALQFHFHGKNVKKLHKYFSPSILPAEFQGELQPFDSKEWGRKMAQSADYLTYVFSHGYEKHKAKAKDTKR